MLCEVWSGLILVTYNRKPGPLTVQSGFYRIHLTTLITSLVDFLRLLKKHKIHRHEISTMAQLFNCLNIHVIVSRALFVRCSETHFDDMFC